LHSGNEKSSSMYSVIKSPFFLWNKTPKKIWWGKEAMRIFFIKILKPSKSLGILRCIEGFSTKYNKGQSLINRLLKPNLDEKFIKFKNRGLLHLVGE